jgi:predicted metal-dependent hydrolase
MTHPHSAFGAPPQGGLAGDPAQPDSLLLDATGLRHGSAICDEKTATTGRNSSAPGWPWNEDVFRTRLFDALSILLPSGETFVVESVEQAALSLDQDSPQCATLRKEALRFVREEVSHQRAHRLYNDRLQLDGAPARELEQRIAAATRQLDTLDLHTRLAFATAFEQLTALISHEILRGPAWLTGKACRQADMWRWHCAEEIGHRHVTPWLLRAHRVATWRRMACFVAATGLLFIDVAGLVAALCAHDVRRRAVSRTTLLRQACRFAWRVSPSVVRMTGRWIGQLFVSR